MKMPKEITRYCPHCRKHTKQKIFQVKSGKRRGALKAGARRYAAKISGYTGFPRPKPEKSKKWGVKLTKRVDLRYKCSVCGKMSVRRSSFRIKKLEMEAVQK
jgi:large subunit ribosomal protein L44e